MRRIVRFRERGQSFKEIAVGLGVVAVGITVAAGAYALIAGGDDGDDVPADFRAAARRAANNTVLDLDDLPAGWALDDDQEEDDDELGLSSECEILNVDEPPGQVAYVATDDFEGPNGQTVSTDATVFQSAEQAGQTLDEYIDALTRCPR